jgi:transcriptional regulator with XRE-family HTH domain
MPRNNRLKDAIFRSGRFQYAIAQEAGLTETRLSRLIQGRALPTPLERRRIATVLRCPEAELFALRSDQAA